MLPEERDSKLERVEFELRTTGVKTDQANPLRSGIHTRGYLPHVKREGAGYFVTFRLADSLPREVFFKLQQERAERLNRVCLQQSATGKVQATKSRSAALQEIERDYFRRIEEYLDKGSGECWLRRPEIAGLVGGALGLFQGERYQLRAWVVMPNHVHVVLWPMPNHTLSAILKGWKGYTAREANKLLGRTGQSFWQRESYDHWIRNDVEHHRCCRYVTNNPVKARLCRAAEDWPWSSAWRRRQPS